jgi:hypothetical protein
MKYVRQRHQNTCFQACIESFLDHYGICRTQELLLKDHEDISNIELTKPGLVSFDKQQLLCSREGIDFSDFCKNKTQDELIEMRDLLKNNNDNEGYLFGLIHRDGGGHAVLFDSIGPSGEIYVMDPCDQEREYVNILDDNSFESVNIHKLINTNKSL